MVRVVVLEERAMAASMVSLFRTWMGVGGKWGQKRGRRWGVLGASCRIPVAGAVGRDFRSDGRRDLVSCAMRARRVLRVEEGMGGGAWWRLARREG